MLNFTILYWILGYSDHFGTIFVKISYSGKELCVLKKKNLNVRSYPSGPILPISTVQYYR